MLSRGRGLKGTATDTEGRVTYCNRCRSGRALLLILAMASMGGCSLISVKSPERPLSARDLNARVLVREQSAHFVATVERCADTINLQEHDRAVLTRTLRWEIAATTHSVMAATQITPMIALLDSWALALQMQDFVGAGHAGGALFGAHQSAVRRVTDENADAVIQLAHGLTSSKEFAQYRDFIVAYTRDYPITDLNFVRAPLVQIWSRQGGERGALIDTLGTIPQAMSDFTQRLQIYGASAQSQAVLQTQLALSASGYSVSDIKGEIKQLELRMDRMTAAAEKAPDTVRQAIGDVRNSLITIINKLNEASASMIASLHEERVAMTADVSAEREAALLAIDQQRRALAVDASRVGDQIVITAGHQIRLLVREALLLLILFAIALLGLPFAAGYLVGRSRRDRSV
jgi:hypothetical protein